jgi:threonine dehydrogenase-like Zn-dependent dehydrogenase
METTVDGDPKCEAIRDTDVLIVGAGPTGLVLALWLTRLGVLVRIVDKTAEPRCGSLTSHVGYFRCRQNRRRPIKFPRFGASG